MFEINFISNVVAIIYIISKRRLQSLIVSIYMLFRVVLSESQLKEKKFISSLTFSRACPHEIFSKVDWLFMKSAKIDVTPRTICCV